MRRKEGVRRRPALRLLPAIVVAAVVSLAVGIGLAVAEDDPQPIDFTHNSFDADAPVTGGVFGSGPAFKTGVAICTTPTQLAPNVNTDCDATASNGITNPHNETSIAVNPTNTQNIVGGANDYQLGINPGGHVSQTLRSLAHVSFDGGKTWSEYPLYSNSAYQATGDPAVAFDASGHAYYATLGFRFVGPANAQNPDILVANSGDKGKTWDVARVASGSGVQTSVGDLLDKEYIAAWGAGNAIVTWGDFRLLGKGSFSTAKIYSSVTHNFGKTWSAPQIISGDLDSSFVSVPTVAADGSIYVAFMNTEFLDPATADFGRDVYRVVRVSPATGARVAGPFSVAKVIDGLYDYPIFGGRQTYQDSIFRTWAAGNITADPKNAAHLAVVWSDMRNSSKPAPDFDPYKSVTNSDVVVSESFDRGATWSTPTALTLAKDQFMPWGAYDQTGQLRIGFFDRQYDATNHQYGYSLATAAAVIGTTPASTFTPVQVTTALSDPTKNDRWFAATVNPAFPFATTFIGDYSNIAIVPNATTTGTGVVAYWTDMRNEACFPPGGRCGHGEDAYFARVGG